MRNITDRLTTLKIRYVDCSTKHKCYQKFFTNITLISQDLSPSDLAKRKYAREYYRNASAPYMSWKIEDILKRGGCQGPFGVPGITKCYHKIDEVWLHDKVKNFMSNQPENRELSFALQTIIYHHDHINAEGEGRRVSSFIRGQLEWAKLAAKDTKITCVFCHAMKTVNSNDSEKGQQRVTSRLAGTSKRQGVVSMEGRVESDLFYNSFKETTKGARKGKSTVEERKYVDRLISEFESGHLPMTNGVRLRNFLSTVLNCSITRIIRFFVPTIPEYNLFENRMNEVLSEQWEKTKAELLVLERRMLEQDPKYDEDLSPSILCEVLKTTTILNDDGQELTVLPLKPIMGKKHWSKEALEYANRVMTEFNDGHLPLVNGTLLRTFLCELIKRRIFNSFRKLKCSGRYLSKMNEVLPEQWEKTKAELLVLERTFLDRDLKYDEDPSPSILSAWLDTSSEVLEYGNRIIVEFTAGHLPLYGGTQLRGLLLKLFNLSEGSIHPIMRNGGTNTYSTRITELSIDQWTKTKNELLELEHLYFVKEDRNCDESILATLLHEPRVTINSDGEERCSRYRRIN